MCGRFIIPDYAPRQQAVAASSRSAYRDNQEKFASIADRVMTKMHDGILRTRAQLARDLGVATATMSGRIHELVKEGKLVERPGVICPVTNRRVRGLRRGAVAHEPSRT